MTFSEQLNEYLSILNCSAKELSQISGLSNSVISRYRSGERVPRPESEKLNQLCEGIYLLSKEKAASMRTSASITPFTKDEIYTAFTNTLKQPDNSRLCENFNHLLLASSVSLADLARFLNYDSSYLSRIRSGSRIPSDPEWFCSETARFIVLRTPPADRIFIEKLTGQSIKDINDSAALCQLLSGWLLNTNTISPQINQMQSFLEKLDQFDLNNFIRSIRFDELKVPTMPIQLPGSRSYFGIREFMTAELDYLKTTVLSPSMENVIMYSDMPMEEMSKDPDFPKKWMFGMAMLLKKGLRINMIHNVNRPFSEMMLGLESYIPMYMTGQISPYYLNETPNQVFGHFLKVSGTVALSGECIAGFHNDGKYYLTKKKDEVSYYRHRAQALLSHARPLMRIFRSDNEIQYKTLRTRLFASGSQRNIVASLPIYTMTDDLLCSIFAQNYVSKSDAAKIFSYTAAERARVESFLATASLTDEISPIDKDEFERYPLRLFLADLFLEHDIVYTWDTYQKHLALTKQYAKTHGSYSLKISTTPAFRNIQIQICEGKWAVISKNNSPAIHFVVEHKKLRHAIENMVMPLVET